MSQQDYELPIYKNNKKRCTINIVHRNHRLGFGKSIENERIFMPRLTEQDIRKIKEILSTNHGPCPVYFNFKTPDSGEYVFKSRKIMAKPSPALMNKLSDIIGVENIWIES